MGRKGIGLVLLGLLLAMARPAAAFDCSENGMQAEMNAYQAAQPKPGNMCQSAQLQIVLMKKQLEVLDRCPGSDPTGDSHFQAKESIKASQNTLDTMCSNN
jgi:hypothetical protein